MSMPSTIESITTAFERERQGNLKAVGAEDIPISYEAITVEWLTSVLCARHPGARVISHRLDRADDGSSNRRRIFLDYNELGEQAGLPRSVFCKASHGLMNRILLGVTGAVHGEVTFYNKVRGSLNIEAPRSYFANYDPISFNSLIMLADLGATTEFCTHTTRMTRARAESQLRLLASFHGKFYDAPELTTTYSTLPTWAEFFEGCEALGNERSCDNGFVAAEDVIPARLYARRAGIWPATQQSLQLHRERPHTLAHGDVHLRNWYITAAGNMGLSDWQVLNRGHWSRDLAYAVSTALTVEDRREWEVELIRYYFDHLQQSAGRSIAFEGVMDAYRQQLLSALAFWTITLTPSQSMPDMQPRNVTLEFIKRIATAIDDLDAMDSFKAH